MIPMGATWLRFPRFVGDAAMQLPVLRLLRTLDVGPLVVWGPALAVALVTLIVFAIFWHVTTGEWRQYIPTRKFLREMVAFYLTGIFKGASHPVKKHRMAKLNPLQRLAYLGFKVLIIPVQITTGALYYFYPNLQHAFGWSPSALWFIAVVHVLGAFGLVAFLIGHVYLTTTGHTPLTNIKAMITGWEDLPDDEYFDENP